MSWSAEQLSAIQARHQNLLVAAAAGSGKTSVLVERIIQRVLDKEVPVDIDHMLVVTFTNAAAAEMRERVGTALSEALKERPHAKNIERQLLLLNSASISTIHSFCQNVIRQHFHLLSLSPKFRIANEVETGLLKMHLLEKLFETKYSVADSSFLNVVEHYAGEKGDDALYNLVLSLYDFSRSHPDPDGWLCSLVKQYALPADIDMEDTPWSKLIRDKFRTVLVGCKQNMERLCCELDEPGNPSAYIGTFQSDIAVLEELLQGTADSWQRLYAAIHAYEFMRLPSVGKEIAPEVKEYFQGERNKVKKKISEIREELFVRPPEALLEDMRLAAPLVADLVSLVAEFSEAYTKAKSSKNLLDFSDLEHYCLKVLAERGENGKLIPTQAAEALQAKYTEIMVDEYQDTNGVQEAILQMVARKEEPNLFMVGDVKQSIYRFRLAEPELFLQKYRNYGAGTAKDCRIDLAKNFRSRAGILETINFVFRQVMKPDVAELEYGEAECLYPGADYPATEKICFNGQVELLLIDRKDKPEQSGEREEQDEAGEENGEAALTEQNTAEELSGFELESRLIVRRIKELMASGCHVWDKTAKQYRLLAWRDIVILLRSVKGKADILLETMRQAGIPVYAELSEGYFRETEVQVMLSLLSIVDNPRQDIHLAGVLRSPLFAFHEAELAQIRLCKRQGDLWEALVKAAKVFGEQEPIGQKINTFLSRLNKWRDVSRSKGVPELVWKIYRDTGYYDYIGGLPGGVIRQANLRALYDRARQYEDTNFRGLFRFLKYIEKLRDKGSDLSVARALGESEDVVRVMSIHKSKGIEFPVVFVADMNKHFNMQDSRQPVVKHKKLGVGVYVSMPNVRLKYPTLAYRGIAAKQEMETRAEELRVLYVAMTRAREKLILTAAVKELDKKCRKWQGDADIADQFLPDSVIAGANSYLDWLGPALMRQKDGQCRTEYVGREQGGFPANSKGLSWNIQLVNSSELTAQEATVTNEVVLDKVKSLESLEAGEGGEWVEQILGWRYPQRIAVDKPAKMSVTEIKRRFESVNSGDNEKVYKSNPIYDQPRFMQKTQRLTAAEQGTAMHTVMQHVDLREDLSYQGLQEQVERLVKKEIILPEHAAQLDLTAVSEYFTTSLGQRMLAADYLRREIPFSMMLPAEQFYPDMKGTEEKIFVQGVIDCLFRDQEGLALIDYKTDRTQNSAAALKEKYGIQLAIYAQAVKIIFKAEVKDKYLYVFSTGAIVKL